MKLQEATFDSQRYWEERLRTHPDITGVGYLGLSSRFVEQYYQSRMHQVEVALRQYGLVDMSERSVLDVGSGTGFWLNFWHQLGAAQVTALDFAQSSVEILKKQFPGDRIVQADVCVAPLPLPDTMRFDVISAFEVFLHVLDYDAFQGAIANLASYCVPGGWLIISDPIVQGRGYLPAPARAAYCKVRPVSEYQQALSAHSFVIESVRPATVLLCNPLEAPNRLVFRALSTMWRVTGKWARSERLAGLIGPGMVKADQLICGLYSHGNAPGSKVIFARKLNFKSEQDCRYGKINTVDAKG